MLSLEASIPSHVFHRLLDPHAKDPNHFVDLLTSDRARWRDDAHVDHRAQDQAEFLAVLVDAVSDLVVEFERVFASWIDLALDTRHQTDSAYISDERDVAKLLPSLLEVG